MTRGPDTSAVPAGFAERDVAVEATTLHVATGGSGPPVLLLHGYPETHRMWDRVAVQLAQRYTVIAPDLRGYGDSGKPTAGSDHAEYGKRAMAADQVQLMDALGFERFAVAGHDRGGRVAHRLCLDHPERVSRAAVLDIVPTLHMFEQVDMAFAMTYFHWFFLAQAPDLPEHMIGADAEGWLRGALGRWSAAGAEGSAFAPEAVAEYVRCFAEPAAITASCEDYRAGTTIDLQHDRASRAAGQRVVVPLVALYGARGFVGRQYDVESVWREYADDVTAVGVDCGHFIPEEAPDETVALLTEHLDG